MNKMLLISNIDFDNSDLESGHEEDVRVSFTLPRKLRRDAKLKIRYCSFYQGMYDTNTNQTANIATVGSVRRYNHRYHPQEIQLSILGNGQDLMNNNIIMEQIGIDSAPKNASSITFHRTMVAEPSVHSLGVITENTTPWRNSMPYSSGHRKVYDLNVANVYDNINEIELVIKIIRDNKRVGDDGGTFSEEEKVRIDSITLHLELIE